MDKKTWRAHKYGKPKRNTAIAQNASNINPTNGLGGIQDKSVGEMLMPGTEGNPFIYNRNKLAMAYYGWKLYSSDWACQKLADIPVFDMYREGWELKYNGDEPNKTEIEKAINDFEDKLGLKTAFQRANRLERIFGGAVIIIGTFERGDNTATPLKPEMIDRGGLRYLNVVSRTHISKCTYDEDVASPTYGRPQYYYIGNRIFHKSRLIVFDNNPISLNPAFDFYWAAGHNDGMGISVYAPLWDAIMRANTYQQCAEHLALTANIWIASRTGLKDLESKRGGNKVIRRFQQLLEQMNMFKAGVIDEEYNITQLASNFGGIPELITNQYQLIAAGSDIPASRFFGSPPGGLSTDDRSGLENYYNMIQARQKMYIDPKLAQITPLILNAIFGRDKINPSDIEREWKPLWNLSDQEKASIRQMDINNAIQLMDSNLLTQADAIEEVRKRDAMMVEPDVEQLEADSEALKMEEERDAELSELGIKEPQERDDEQDEGDRAGQETKRPKQAPVPPMHKSPGVPK